MTARPEERFPSAADRTDHIFPNGHGDQELITRGVTEADLPGLLRVEKAAFPEDPYPHFVMRQLFDIHRDHILVLDDGESLHGYALFVTVPDGRVSWVMSLAVTPDHRTRGLGRRLMDEVLRRVRTEGVHEVCLTVDPANTPAVALYRSLGFCAEAEVRRDYFGAGEDRLVMRLRL
jgi:ribosomal-protein-alanine N-acetyltransferase